MKVGLEGAGFLTELTELTKLADPQELGYRRAAVGLLLSDTSISSVISVPLWLSCSGFSPVLFPFR